MRSKESLAASHVAPPPRLTSSREHRTDRRPDFFLVAQSRDTPRDVLYGAHTDTGAKLHHNKERDCQNSDDVDAPFLRDVGTATRTSFAGRDATRDARGAIPNMHGHVGSSLHNKEDGDRQRPGSGDAPPRRDGVALVRARPPLSLARARPLPPRVSPQVAAARRPAEATARTRGAWCAPQGQGHGCGGAPPPMPQG